MKSKLTDIAKAKDAVRNAVDIFAIIKADLPDHEWKESGDGFWTDSPFRVETKPSFCVNIKKKIVKDFGGDGFGGDVFAWLMFWHGMSFEEAIIHAARVGGFDITPFLRDPTPEELQRNKYITANAEAAKWMHQNLRENILVRDDYLSRSNFTLEMIEPYQVGYCPSSDALVSHVCRHVQLSDDDIRRLEFNRHDLFTDALVYPIHNASGEVVVFRTKLVNENPSLIGRAKYLGMRSEHPLYEPGVVYGLHVAKKNFKFTGPRLNVVEGHRDVIALSPMGTVGCMGQALTLEQIKTLVTHGIKQLTLMYDGDLTGQTQSLEVINRLDDFSRMFVTIARPPLDIDPHELWRTQGQQAVDERLKAAMMPIEFYVRYNYTTDRALTYTEQNKLITDLKDHLLKLNGLNLEMTASYLAGVIGCRQEKILDHVAELKVKFTEMHNTEAERAVIYYCVNSPQSCNSFKAAGIIPQSFALSTHQKIYDGALISYEKFNINYTPQVVLEEAMRKYADPDIQTRIVQVMENPPIYTEVLACERVLDLWRRRTAATQATELASLVRDLNRPLPEIIEHHRKILISTMSSSKPQAREPAELAAEFMSTMMERHARGGNIIIGHDFSSAMPYLNMVLGGIQNGHMSVIAGPTNAGKSLLALNIVKSIAIDKNIPWLWIAQEMSSVETSMRNVSLISGMNNTRVQAGAVGRNPVDFNTIRDAAARLGASQFYCAKPRDGTIDEVLSIVDEFRFRHGIQGVTWDYIQLVQPNKSQYGMGREEVIGMASKAVKNRITEDMGLAAIVIAQLNRDKMAKGTEQVGGSYQISQDADDFVEIVKKDKKEIEEDGINMGNRYIRIRKRRGGVSEFGISAYVDDETGGSSLRIMEKADYKQIAETYSKIMG